MESFDFVYQYLDKQVDGQLLAIRAIKPSFTVAEAVWFRALLDMEMNDDSVPPSLDAFLKVWKNREIFGYINRWNTTIHIMIQEKDDIYQIVQVNEYHLKGIGSSDLEIPGIFHICMFENDGVKKYKIMVNIEEYKKLRVLQIKYKDSFSEENDSRPWIKQFTFSD